MTSQPSGIRGMSVRCSANTVGEACAGLSGNIDVVARAAFRRLDR